MGVPIEYDDDVERRRIHPLLLPEVEAKGVSQGDSDPLEKIQVVAPTKKMPSYKSIRSVLREPKYGPGSEPQWKSGRTRYPAFYKALLE